MIKFELYCDFCGAKYEDNAKSSPGDLLRSYKNLKEDAIASDWVYHTWNKRLYCPECAEYRNAYEGDLKYKNGENFPGWHYVAANDLPPLDNTGISETVHNQEGKEVFYTRNSGWLYKDPSAVGKTYAPVYKWRNI